MMTPTSVRDAHAAIDADTGEDNDVVQSPGDDFDRSFEKAFESAYDTVTKRDADAPKIAGSLDDLITSGLERQEADQEEREAFKRSREHRDELRSRYGKSVSLGEVLKSFAALDEGFQKDPVGTADRLTSFYLTRPYGEIDRNVQKNGSRVETKDQHPWRRMDAIISDAQTTSADATDDDDLEATAEVRALLKKKYPELSFDQLVERVAQVDRDLHRDPVGAAARLAASYGAVVTETQHAAVQHAALAQQQERAIAADVVRLAQSGKFPHLDKLADDVVAVLQHQDFVRTPNLHENLHRAYYVALARQAEAARAARVEKAERASPVRTSPMQPGGSGAPGHAGDGNLSALIGKALADVA
jgi:hypothetical protein